MLSNLALTTGTILSIGLISTNAAMDVSNPWASDNEAYFRSFMDRTNGKWGPVIYETGFCRFYKDYGDQYDKALEGIIREAHHVANQAFDGKGGKVKFFTVNQEGLGLSYESGFLANSAKIAQLDENTKNGPILSFDVTLLNTADFEKGTRRVDLKSEWKTVKEWEQHRLPKVGISDLHLMHAAMKPTDKVKSTERRRLMMSDVSNPFVSDNEAHFRSFMDRTNGKWGPVIYETGFCRFYKDYGKQFDLALEGIIREAHHLANEAFDGKGGKVRFFLVNQEGLGLGSNFHPSVIKQLAENTKNGPRMSFNLTVLDTAAFEKETVRVDLKSEWKTVKEWEQHRLPVAQVAKPAPKKAGISDLHQMYAAMKPTDAVKKSVQVRLASMEECKMCEETS